MPKSRCKIPFSNCIIESKEYENKATITASLLQKLLEQATRLDKKAMLIIGIKIDKTVYKLKCELTSEKIH